MTQKEALQNIFSHIDNKFARREFLVNWLEDINWHSECNIIREMDKDIFDGKKKVENGKMFEYEMKNATEAIKGFNLIYGWGLDHSWISGGRGQAFVNELLEIATA